MRALFFITSFASLARTRVSQDSGSGSREFCGARRAFVSACMCVSADRHTHDSIKIAHTHALYCAIEAQTREFSRTHRTHLSVLLALAKNSRRWVRFYSVSTRALRGRTHTHAVFLFSSACPTAAAAAAAIRQVVPAFGATKPHAYSVRVGRAH